MEADGYASPSPEGRSKRRGCTKKKIRFAEKFLEGFSQEASIFRKYFPTGKIFCKKLFSQEYK